jgi:hypothetical protein
MTRSNMSMAGRESPGTQPSFWTMSRSRFALKSSPSAKTGHLHCGPNPRANRLLSRPNHGRTLRQYRRSHCHRARLSLNANCRHPMPTRTYQLSAEVTEWIVEREFVAHFFRIVMVLAIRLRLRCSLGQAAIMRRTDLTRGVSVTWGLWTLLHSQSPWHPDRWHPGTHQPRLLLLAMPGA